MRRTERSATDVDGSPTVETHRSHRIAVYRVENEGVGHPYDFELFVDEDFVASANQLDRRNVMKGPGHDNGGPWVPQLVAYGKNKVDSVEGGRGPDHEFDFGGGPR